VLAGIAVDSAVVGLLSGETGTNAALRASRIALPGNGVIFVLPLARKSVAAYMVAMILFIVAASGVLMVLEPLAP